MSKRAGAVLFLLLAAAFLIVNRGAYRGYFHDDELDTLSWAPRLRPIEIVKALVTPRFLTNNFRPAAHFYFYTAGRSFGLDYPKYIAVLHAIHLFNVWLLWLLMRRLGAKPWAAAAGCLFFALHMALFDAVWKPMYVYDVLCATFCLLTLLAYAHGRWVLGLPAFWLAYKCKELAVMLPLVLALCEYWFGKRRWLRLAPYFAISLSFGLQGVLLNTHHDDAYTFRFTPAAVGETSVFYAARVFLVPYLGFVIPVAAWLARNRRAWFGAAMMGILFVPLLFLPGRLFSAYCYLPFTGLAIAFAGLVESRHPAVAAIFFLLWAPMEYRELRTQRQARLAVDNDVREWVTTAAGLARTAPRVKAIVYAGEPAGFEAWGVRGALHFVFHRSDDLTVRFIEDPDAAKLLASDDVALLSWDHERKKLGVLLRTPQ